MIPAGPTALRTDTHRRVPRFDRTAANRAGHACGCERVPRIACVADHHGASSTSAGCRPRLGDGRLAIAPSILMLILILGIEPLALFTKPAAEPVHSVMPPQGIMSADDTDCDAPAGIDGAFCAKSCAPDP